MTPEVVKRSEMLLAGIVNCGKDVSSIDISELWNLYEKSEPKIRNRIEGSWYELHVGERLGNGIYGVLAGAQIEEIEDLPPEVSVKVIPAGRYAHFAHSMKDGGFGRAFATVDDWMQGSHTSVKDFGLQYYGRDFDPHNQESVLHIYIPLAE
jgi:predicted transcriptional regulator YdeE